MFMEKNQWVIRWREREVSLFNKGLENVYDDEQSRWPSLANDNMMGAIEEKIADNR